MDLYARINILGGLAVRLPHGGLDEAIPLDNDPIGRAKGWAKQGVDYIHVVDLDAAAFGDYRNRDLITQLVDELRIPVQVAGGIRSEAEAERLIAAGAWRIVMGTAAIENQNMVWDLCRRYPDKIVISLDVRPNEELATRGWTQNSGRFLEEVLIEMSSAGATAFLVAEAGRDALTDPPNYRILAEALSIVEEPVIAAGGVRDLDDLRKLVQLEASGRHLAGVIVGREVTAGRFTVPEAKEVLAGGGPQHAPGDVIGLTAALGVGSLARSLDFYSGVLGFEKVRSSAGDEATSVLQAGHGQRVKLVEGGDQRPAHLAFQVSDLERWREHLTSVGVDFELDATGITLTDPDGHLLELRGS